MRGSQRDRCRRANNVDYPSGGRPRSRCRPNAEIPGGAHPEPPRPAKLLGRKMGDVIYNEQTAEDRAPPLFFSMLFGVGLHRFFRMRSGMNRMAHRCLSVMCRLLVVSGLVVLGCLLVMS